MSSQRKIRAEKREKRETPQNFTCGVCGCVHKYLDDFYKCEKEITPDDEEAS